MSGSHWVTEPNAYLEPKVESSGFASLKPVTIIDQFTAVVEKHADKPALALKRKVNGKVPEEWTMWTWQEYYADCEKFARAIAFLEVPVFGIVNILGFNSPEWFIANNGSILAGAIAAGIYATNLPEACKYITEHSKAALIVLEGNKQLEKYVKSAKSLKHLKVICVWGEQINPSLKTAIESSGKIKVMSWEAMMKLGEENFSLESRQLKIRPGNCSTLIYTSGTTGNPKAVMISHDNVTWTARNMVDNYVQVLASDRILSYLPLSHIAAQIMDVHVPLMTGACCYFAQPDALKGSLVESLKDVKPTIFFGVPRVWEKINEKMAAVGRSVTGVKKMLSTYAKSLALEKNKNAQFGEDNSAPFMYGCMKGLVLSKIRQAIGLDECRSCFTAAAPISVETLEYFASLDIPVYEVFGQSECTGPHTISVESQWKIGYCGRPMLGTESDTSRNGGELCYRGRHIFMGYMYMPDKTAETIDKDGWLHSGDVAEFDSDNIEGMKKPSGFMKITGRIKELIITAGGENIPPVLIENEMKAAMLAVSNCMVVGDRRKFLGMLVALKCEMDPNTGAATDQLASDALFEGGKIGSSAKTLSEAAVDPLWIEYINAGVKEANSKTTSNAQIVNKWVMMPEDFSEAAGDLTPTQKLKRNVVTDKYADLINNKIYGDNGNV